ncbi:glycosyltransferase family 2 protein [Abyssibacter sp.]|uniref:glycosyltransferase n=1 Tax=Abyssibacter sp. TaxID=2320200 RepID=UPI003516B581
MPEHSDHLAVSVIIPVFNDLVGLKRCLKSLLRQSYAPEAFEVVVVDNGSSLPIGLDPSTYPFLLQVIVCHTPGSYAARNAGVGIARGRVLAFTDADCAPASNWLAEGMRALSLHDGGVVVGGNVVIREPEHRTPTGLYQYLTGFYQKENIVSSGFAVTANLLCSKALFMRIGQFDERLFSGGDREWGARAQQFGAQLIYAEASMVETWPRTKLGAAIRQTRRTAAGRWMIRDLGLVRDPASALAPHRSPVVAAIWILKHPRLSALEKVCVLIVAIVLKITAWIEFARCRFGMSPERR